MQETLVDCMDKELCNCEECQNEIQTFGLLTRGISTLPSCVRGFPCPTSPLDFSEVKTLRDILLIMKPFVHALNEVLRSIEPLE